MSVDSDKLTESLVREVLLGLCWKTACSRDLGGVVGFVGQLQNDFK